MLVEHRIRDAPFCFLSDGGDDDGSIRSLLDPRRCAHLTAAVSTATADLIPGPAFYAARQAVVARLNQLVRGGVPWRCGVLRAFGSSANNFGGHGADLDLCLELPKDEEGSPTPCQAVEDLGALLNANGFLEVDDARKAARIPILQFVDPETGLDCDICINNRLALRNTALLKTYSLVDPRVKVLAAVVKRWSKQRGINSPPDHTLSSYGYLLLLIHFLQRRCPHPVLPVLQRLPPEWDGNWSGRSEGNSRHGASALPTVPVEGNDGRVHETYFYADPDSPVFAGPGATELGEHNEAQLALLRAFAARNTESVGELLVKFFHDYAFGEFDPRRHVCSECWSLPFPRWARSHSPIQTTARRHPNGDFASEGPESRGGLLENARPLRDRGPVRDWLRRGPRAARPHIPRRTGGGGARLRRARGQARR